MNASGLSKWLAKFHGERIDALKSVRNALGEIKKGSIHNPKGSSLEVIFQDGKAIKFPTTLFKQTPERMEKIQQETRRRGFLESILSDNGIAPETYVVETKNKKYMVQPEADRMNYGEPRATPIGKGMTSDHYDKLGLPKDVEFWEKQQAVNKDVSDKVADVGMTSKDLIGKNIGFFGGVPKVIDAGHEKLKRPMTPAERESAISKFISYGKRPSLQKWIKKNQDGE